MSEAPESSIERIDRYELRRKLAQGGMAEIFLAREQGIGGLARHVVLKRILPHLADDPDFVEMFLREARIIARLNHPNVVQIYELGEADGHYFIAMEYLHGVSVRELQAAAEDEPLPIDTVLSIVVGVCRGAHAAHELTDEEGRALRIVHRDISPHNVMVTSAGDVKLLDFGIAKASAMDGLETTVGGLKGKYAYMSPEQCMRRPLDRRSDIFSIGIVLWELLTHQRLFLKHSELEIMQAIIQDPVPSVHHVQPDLPEGLDPILQKALAKDPDERYPDADAFRLELLKLAQRCGFILGSDALAPCVHGLADELLKERAPGTHTHRSTPAVAGPLPTHTTNGDATAVSRPPRGDHQGTHPGAAQPEVTALPEPRPQRRRFFLMAGSLCAMVLVGLSLWMMFSPGTSETHADHTTAAPSAALEGPALKVGWAPVLYSEALLKEIEPLRTFLQHELKQPIQFVISDSYQDLADRLVASRVAFAVMPPMLYMRTRMAHHELEPLVIKEAVGSTSTEGYLVVLRDSPYMILNDLEGRRFCFTDQNSTSGHHLPRAFLKRSGKDPDSFIGAIHWSGNHLQVLHDLVAGTCDVAATYSNNLKRAEEHGIKPGTTRPLAITGHAPQDVVVASPTTPQALKERVRSVLLRFHSSDVGSESITAFKPASDPVFDSLRELMEE